MKTIRPWAMAAAVLLLALGGTAVSQTPPTPPVFTVRMDARLDKPASGRLIIVAAPASAVLRTTGLPLSQAEIRQHLADELTAINASGFGVSPSPNSGSAAAARPDVTLASGQSVTVDGDAIAFPGFSSLKPDLYFVRAILDTKGDYAYNQQPAPGSILSDVVAVNLPAERPVLTLKTVREAPTPLWDRPDPRLRPPSPGRGANALADAQQAYDLAQTVKARTERVYFNSKLLSAFWSKPTDIRAYVLTPPGYDGNQAHYPTVFETEGFGATFDGNFGRVERTYQDMVSGLMPPMIWVFVDHAGPTGTHEFADSANNGPWGKALTTEFIPWLDGKYRTDGRASGRFTTGHSSGGWASLWLQVAYPKLFGGAWPTSPDPVDFHDFTNIDLYRAGANAYRQPNGSPTLLVRSARPSTLEQYAKSERVLGPAGGQMSSFDWVFSPRGRDGKPVPMFNEKTGAVDPAVAAYWNAHYDITALIKRDWKTLKPNLDGKIHLWVGTLDTYYLDGPAHLLKAALDGLGAKSEFHFINGADHGSVMVENGDPRGVERTMAWQMYATARPGSKRPPIR